MAVLFAEKSSEEHSLKISIPKGKKYAITKCLQFVYSSVTKNCNYYKKRKSLEIMLLY